MQTFTKKFNAQRSADRQFRATGNKHIVKPITGGFVVLPELEGAAPVEVAAPAKVRAKRVVKAAAAVIAAPVALPTPPDFSKPTHAGYRKKLAALVALAEAGDVAGLKAFPIVPASSSRKALDRYRNSAVTALTGAAG